MSTVYTTIDYDYTDIRTKVTIWFWYLESAGCMNKTKKATRYACTTDLR